MGENAHPRYADPGVLEILGALSEAVGLAEHIQRLFPRGRKIQRRHRQIDKQVAAFAEKLQDARTAVRLLQGVVGGPARGLESGTIGFSIVAAELPLYRRGLEQLQSAIRGMTTAAYSLEDLTQPFADETERFYRVSSVGDAVLRILAQALLSLA